MPRVALWRGACAALAAAFCAGGALGALAMRQYDNRPPYVGYAARRWGGGVFEAKLVEEATAAYTDCKGQLVAFREKQSEFSAAVAAHERATAKLTGAWRDCCAFKTRECVEQRCALLFSTSVQ